MKDYLKAFLYYNSKKLLLIISRGKYPAATSTRISEESRRESTDQFLQFLEEIMNQYLAEPLEKFLKKHK